MLDSGLLSKNFIGRDGFIWWIGQIPDAKVWKGNIPTLPQNNSSNLPGFKDRVKVRILGYHTSNVNLLSDEDLPWALVMLPTTAGGGSGANAVSPRFAGGEFVFGFFLDGDNGQQPVIIGLLGNSTQTLLSKTIPSVGFKPFSGYTSSLKRTPNHSLKDSKSIENTRTPNPNQTIPTGSAGGQSSASIPVTSPSTTDSESQESSRATADQKTNHQEAQQEDNKEFTTANACKDNKKQGSGIQTAIKNLVKFMRSIRKYFDAYVNPVTNEISKISSQITNVARIISGYLKDILNGVRSYILDKLNAGIKDATAFLGIKKQNKIGEEQEKAVNLISCAFNNIISGLFDLVKNFLTKMLDRLLSAASCLIDNMIAALLDSILGPIQNILSTVFSGINSLLSGAGSILLSIDAAANFISSLTSFFSCEQKDKCPDINKWSWLDGPKPESSAGFANAVSKVGNYPTSSLTNLAKQNSLFNNYGANNQSIGGCDTGLTNCGPPLVKIFGGGGDGAIANAIVSPSGEILAVDLINRGIDYYSNPFIYFDDACGNGSGAKAVAIVGPDPNPNPPPPPPGPPGPNSELKGYTKCGKLLEIKVIDGGKGYLPSPDGSMGSEGDTVIGIGSGAKSLILLGKGSTGITTNTFGFEDLFIDEIISGISTTKELPSLTPNCGVTTEHYNIPISVPCGITVNLPPGATIIIPKISELIIGLTTDYKKTDNQYYFPTGATIRVPCGIGSTTPSKRRIGIGSTSPEEAPEESKTYKVCTRVSGIIIKDTGINYSFDDEIKCDPDVGAVFKPEYDPYGRLINVKILNRGICAPERPKLYIESNTGVNADIFPIMSSEYVSEEDLRNNAYNSKYAYNQGKLISVIDCVGKV
ncbi:hypothetical protein EBS02_00370 [bacterium]|nr:hypothetical protein [bacterium]